MINIQLPRVVSGGLLALFLVLGQAATNSVAARPEQTIAGVKLPEATYTDSVTLVPDPVHDFFKYAYLIKSTPARAKAVVGVNFPALSTPEITPPIGIDKNPRSAEIVIEENWAVPNHGPSSVDGFQIDYKTKAGAVYRSKSLTAMPSIREGQFNAYYIRTKQSDFDLVDGPDQVEQKIVALSVRYRPTNTDSSNSIYLQSIYIRVLRSNTVLDMTYSGKEQAMNDDKFRVK